MGSDSPKTQAVSREPPQQFSYPAFTEAVKALMRADKTMEERGRLLLELAYIAGGPRLAAAINYYTVAPCMGKYDCQTCWLEPYCIHKDTPAGVREEIENLVIEILEKNPLDSILEMLERIDKTSPDALEMIRMIHSQVCLA